MGTPPAWRGCGWRLLLYYLGGGLGGVWGAIGRCIHHPPCLGVPTRGVVSLWCPFGMSAAPHPVGREGGCNPRAQEVEVWRMLDAGCGDTAL